MKRAQLAEAAEKPMVLLDSDASDDNLSSQDEEAFQEKKHWNVPKIWPLLFRF